MLFTKVSQITRLWTSSLTVKLDAFIYILLQNLQISLYSIASKNEMREVDSIYIFLVLTHGPLQENNCNSCYAIMKSVPNFYVKR